VETATSACLAATYSLMYLPTAPVLYRNRLQGATRRMLSRTMEVLSRTMEVSKISMKSKLNLHIAMIEQDRLVRAGQNLRHFLALAI
jgi:hypothetical protein